MRVVTFLDGSTWKAGAVLGQHIYDIGRALAHAGGSADFEPLSVRELLRIHGGSLEAVNAAVEAAARSGMRAHGRLADATLAPPVPDPGKVLCVGLNYRDHVAETGRKLPEFPDVFAKFASSLIGSNDPIGGLQVTEQLDFEGELAVVIGRTARAVTPDEAPRHIAGAMVLNDITARDLQYRGTQWLMGKAVDASTPCGPALVTLDEIGDLQELDVTTRVNGVEMQHSNTRHMIFTVAEIIAYLSRTITLEPGDIIATGTPEGIGAKRTPPTWLRAGDRVTVEIARVGTLASIVGTPEEVAPMRRSA
jgi:2-keto-4-pentenoate hydratase/2-oxohepta-3-ene-1,7-dioic acid hydratase in catechol pathway